MDRSRSWTADEVIEALMGSIARLDEMLPVTVAWDDEWGATARAFVARMAGTLRSIATLAPAGRVGDGATLTRSVWEHAVTLCWLAIDADRNLRKWHADAARREAIRQEDARQFGIEHYGDEMIAKLKATPRAITLKQRAAEADDHWAGKVGGWNPSRDGGRAALLSFRGTYVAIYRTASAQSHPQPESLSEDILRLGESGTPHLVRMEDEGAGEFTLAALCVPLFALSVAVVQRTTGWPGRSIADEYELDLRKVALTASAN